MTKKNISTQAILQEIKALAEQHQISAKEINAFLTTQQTSKKNPETFMKLFAYLGGIFIFSGISIYLGIFWNSMSSLTHVMMTFGVGIIIYLLAVILPLYHKNSQDMLSPLFLTAAFFQTCGLFIIFNEVTTHRDFRIGAVLIFGVMLIQQLLTFSKIKRASLLFMSVFFWSACFVTALDLLHANEKTLATLSGLSLLIIARLLDKKTYKSLASFW